MSSQFTESKIQIPAIERIGFACMFWADLYDVNDSIDSRSMINKARVKGKNRIANIPFPETSLDAVFVFHLPHSTLIEDNRQFHNVLTDDVQVENEIIKTGGRAHVEHVSRVFFGSELF